MADVRWLGRVCPVLLTPAAKTDIFGAPIWR